MKAMLLFFIFSAFQSTPEQIVQKQLDTYNDRDIEGFMSIISNDVSLYNLGESDPIASGHDRVKEIYTNLFQKSPKLHSTLKNRMVMGNKVIDHESITGRLGNDEVLELIVIYEVKADKIFKITVIRP